MSAVLTVVLVVAALIWVDVYCLFMRLFRSRGEMERILDRLGPWWSRRIINIFNIYGFVDVRLQEPLVKDIPKQAVIICNHQSYMDITALFVLLAGSSLRFVGKDSLKFGFPGVTTFLKLGRHAFVKQSGDPVGAIQAVKRFSVRTHKMGHSPVIFPEGTRSRTGELMEFKTGGLRTIAEGSPLPIVVVAVDGGHTIRSMKVLRKGGGAYYRARVVGTLAPAPGKKEMMSMLENARQMIDANMTEWRKELGLL
jgi:1-acyl-sn-glycerol-3-phosphate acyltransferase